MDNSSIFSEKRYKMVCQIQKFLSEGCSYREIAKRMGVGRNTIAKYREGDPEELSMYGIRQSKLDIFYDFIIQCLDSGWSKSKTIKEIYTKGYTGSKSNAFDYLCKIEQKENKYFEVQPYILSLIHIFSNLIDDEDIEFMQHEFISYKQAMDYYELGYKPCLLYTSERDRVEYAGRTCVWLYRTDRIYCQQD